MFAVVQDASCRSKKWSQEKGDECSEGEVMNRQLGCYRY